MEGAVAALRAGHEDVGHVAPRRAAWAGDGHGGRRRARISAPKTALRAAAAVAAVAAAGAEASAAAAPAPTRSIPARRARLATVAALASWNSVLARPT